MAALLACAARRVASMASFARGAFGNAGRFIDVFCVDRRLKLDSRRFICATAVIKVKCRCLPYPPLLHDDDVRNDGNGNPLYHCLSTYIARVSLLAFDDSAVY
jgi:hypothetical protein